MIVKIDQRFQRLRDLEGLDTPDTACVVRETKKAVLVQDGENGISFWVPKAFIREVKFDGLTPFDL